MAPAEERLDFALAIYAGLALESLASWPNAHGKAN